MIGGFFEEDAEGQTVAVLGALGAPKMFEMIHLNIRQLNMIAQSFREDYLDIAYGENEEAYKALADKVEEIEKQKAEMLGRFKELFISLDDLEKRGLKKWSKEDFAEFDKGIDGAFEGFLDGTNDRYEQLMVEHKQVALLLTDEDKSEWIRKLAEKSVNEAGKRKFQEYLEGLKGKFKERLRMLPEKRYAEAFNLARVELINLNEGMTRGIDSVKKVYDDLSKDANLSGKEGLVEGYAYSIRLAEMKLQGTYDGLVSFMGRLKHVLGTAFVVGAMASLGVGAMLAVVASPTLPMLITVGVSWGVVGLARKIGDRYGKFAALKKGFDAIDRLGDAKTGTYLDARKDVKMLLSLSEKHGIKPKDPDAMYQKFLMENDKTKEIVEDGLIEELEVVEVEPSVKFGERI